MGCPTSTRDSRRFVFVFGSIRHRYDSESETMDRKSDTRLHSIWQQQKMKYKSTRDKKKTMKNHMHLSPVFPQPVTTHMFNFIYSMNYFICEPRPGNVKNNNILVGCYSIESYTANTDCRKEISSLEHWANIKHFAKDSLEWLPLAIRVEKGSNSRRALHLLFSKVLFKMQQNGNVNSRAMSAI